VDGGQLGHGLPRRLIALPELAAILMHPSCGYAARDEVWRLLVARARTGDASWTVGAVGVACRGCDGPRIGWRAATPAMCKPRWSPSSWRPSPA
jgi:hypothetical protein